MNWPELSIDDFPPRRDDEPSSLRQDIIDELSDHFVCALNRELLKNPNEGLARKRVLERFGDPIKIARQLWLDEMKEKIMSQRIMTGVSCLMAVCCLAVVGISWMLFRESQAMNQQLLTQVVAMADRPVPLATTQMDPQFLKQLETMIQRKVSQADSSAVAMNSILFQLVSQEKEGDKPAVGFKGTLSNYEGKKLIFQIDAVSDKTGKLDFGKLPWGSYQLKLSAPWNEEIPGFNITTIPGRAFSETIVCPAAVPGKAPVEFQVDWLGKAVEEEMFLICDFRHFNQTYGTHQRRYDLSTRRFIANHTWSYRHNMSVPIERGVYLIDIKNNQATLCPLDNNVDFKNLQFQDLDWSSTVEVIQGEYGPPTIYLVQKKELSKLSELSLIDDIGVISISRLGGVDLSHFANPSSGMFISPFEQFKYEPSKHFAEMKKLSPQAGKKVYGYQADRLTKIYKTTTGKPDVWKIVVPDLNPITEEFGSLTRADL